MRLFEAILAANHRAAAGQADVGEAPTISTSDLPVAVLSCIDARLNRLLPDALGLPEAQLIWLRNAGNIITGPLSSTMRSLALACAVKGAKEIAIVGHTDCQVGKLSVMNLLERLGKQGVDRHRLPENLIEYFGLFGTERQNVIRAVELTRLSPLIGAKIPVHGLMLDLQTGRLESVVDGYQALATPVTGPMGELFQRAEHTLDAFAKIGNAAQEWKLPAAKIGEFAQTAQGWLQKAEQVAAAAEPVLRTKAAEVPPAPPSPPKPPPPVRRK